MAVTIFKPIKSSDQELTLLQNAIKSSLDSLTSNPLLSGNMLRGVTLASGSNIVGHGLGRNYVSFLWGNPSAPVRLSYGKSPDRSKFVNVVADAAVTLDLLVL